MKTVRNAITILNAFSVEKPERGLADLSRAVGIDKVIVHRQLKTMKELDFVEQDPETRRYRLGPGVATLAAVRRAFIKPLDHAVEHLAAVHRATDETVHLAQLEGDLIVVTYARFSPQDLRVVLEVGEMIPAYCTAPGLLFLAHGGAPFRDRQLAGRLRPRAARTVTDRASIEALLPAIRDQGHVIVDQTYSDQAKGIAAPVFGAQGQIVAAATVLGPSFRLAGDREAEAIDLIKAAAARISRDQGYDPARPLDTTGKEEQHG
ncbi:MAG: IclR family transcriptional regulator [Hyphomicrobiales bacterium]|nr:IclR family transcriptional regulator [Hyphomicrobiales bacterium]